MAPPWTIRSSGAVDQRPRRRSYHVKLPCTKRSSRVSPNCLKHQMAAIHLVTSPNCLEHLAHEFTPMKLNTGHENRNTLVLQGEVPNPSHTYFQMSTGEPQVHQNRRKFYVRTSRAPMPPTRLYETLTKALRQLPCQMMSSWPPKHSRSSLIRTRKCICNNRKKKEAASLTSSQLRPDLRSSTTTP